MVQSGLVVPSLDNSGASDQSDTNQDEQSAFKPNQDLDTVRSAQSKPIPNPQIVSDSPLEMVNYQLSGLPLQIPRAFSTVVPSEPKKVKTDITGLM